MKKTTKGYLVKVKATGEEGRTFHRKGTVNGKIPVYNVDHKLNEQGESLPDQPQPVLHRMEDIEAIGMID